MHLKRLTVTGLFHQFNHEIIFPTLNQQESSASIVILHGPNGIGKTTLLRMLNGLLALDFNPFRAVPFMRCELQFSTDEIMSVQPSTDLDTIPPPLIVTFRDASVTLSGARPGAANEADVDTVEQFRQEFFLATEELTFELIDTARLVRSLYLDEKAFLRAGMMPDQVRRLLSGATRNPKAKEPEEPIRLAQKVRQFIRDAQLNYRNFFSSREPDLLPRLLQRILQPASSKFEQSDLLERLDHISRKESAIKRFLLAPELLDFSSLTSLVRSSDLEHRPDSTAALSVLGSYVEMLEARLSERELLAERLKTFEDVMKTFFIGKHVEVDSKKGLRIVTRSGSELTEDQLSSGEYHLLYLMVAALTTRRLGTIIAIDEPEMSMHLSWQRKLVAALIKCASGAEPQFLFATHSPDIAAEYPNSLVQLVPDLSE